MLIEVVPEVVQPVNVAVSKPPLTIAPPGVAGTAIMSKSGAQVAALANVMVLTPACRARFTVLVPGVPKLPVGLNDRVCAAPPFTLTVACRPVVEPSQ